MNKFDCSCGDIESSCSGDIIVCILCQTGHHEACSYDLLKGFDSISKFKLLKINTFKCYECEPSYYSWMFQCKCIHDGKSVIMDYDDGLNMSECFYCHTWSHDQCNFIEINENKPTCNICSLKLKKKKDVNTIENENANEQYNWFQFVPTPSSSITSSSNELAKDDKAYCLKPIETFRMYNALKSENKRNCQTFTGKKKRTKNITSNDNNDSDDDNHDSDDMLSNVKLIKVPRLSQGLYIRKNSKYRDEKIVDEVIVRGIYERPKFDFDILPSDVWLDLGAHIGTFTSLCLQSGSQVISVEPDINNFKVLKLNSSLNITRPLQHIMIHAAVMNEKTTEVRCNQLPNQSKTREKLCLKSHDIINDKEFIQHEQDSHIDLHIHPAIGFRHSTIYKRRRPVEWETNRTPLTNLNQILKNHPTINAIKIDIQGAEVQVLESVSVWPSHIEKLVFEYDFEYSPDLEYFHTFISNLKLHFPYIHHSKLKKSGKFVGFPNGVLVYAKKCIPDA